MGLFSRKAEEEETTNLFDSDELPNSGDLDSKLFEPEREPVVAASPKAAAPKRSLTYGIQDAIDLMRKLPADNKEIVVSVVKQTLESTHISVEDIIADATDKESRLLNKNAQLETEIKQLQQQIADRKSQIASLLEDHKETVSVRERLELAINLDKPKPAPKPAAPNPATSAAAPKSAAPDAQPAGARPEPAATKPGPGSGNPLPH